MCSTSRSSRRAGPRRVVGRRLQRGPAGPARSCRRWGSRSGPRRRRGRGTARRPRRRTSSIRASGRSTLLTTRITGSRASSALRRTKRVWGSGPSEASTSSSTPSTIVSARSTSPPKSACPGVSTMLILTPAWRTAVFLARIVMPFSRSRSIESMTRSATSWLARKAPDCHSIASTSVVLPWSTCATMATLRRSSRATATRASGHGRAWNGPAERHTVRVPAVADLRPTLPEVRSGCAGARGACGPRAGSSPRRRSPRRSPGRWRA